MVNIFNDLKYARLNSRFIRKLLSLFYKKGRIYRIPFGPLKGLRMYYDRTINFHAVLGLWELQNFKLLWKLFIKGQMLRENMIVCDIGADIGVYSLWFSRYLRGNGLIYTFEPSPDIIPILRKNISVNNAINVIIIELACADKTGKLEFFIGLHHHTSSLYAKSTEREQHFREKILVDSTTLDDFFYGKEKKNGPDFIKMDIEGGGIFALKGCDRCIENKRPLFLIESHNPEEDAAISRILLHHNYEAYRINNSQWVKLKSEVFPIREGVWGTLFLCPAELRKEAQCHL